MAIEKRIVSYAVPTKNLFDKNSVDAQWVVGKIKDDSGQELSDNVSTYSSFYIKVKPNTSYTFSWGTEDSSLHVIQRIYFYTKDKVWISRTSAGAIHTFTIPTNGEYIQIQRRNAPYNAATDIMLNEGSTALPYEPYGNTTYKYIKRDHKPNPAWRGLPAGHKQLEYIESTGTQCIDTEIIPNFNYKMEVVGGFVGGKRHFGIGGTDSWSQTWYGFLLANSSGNSAWGRSVSANTAKHLLGMSGNIEDIYKITIDKTGIKVNDVLKVSFSSGSNYETEKSLWLFRSNDCTHVNEGVSREKSAKIWDDNGELVGDFVPDEYNGQVGMYDLINQQFYPNAGTGSFIAGPAVPAATDLGRKIIKYLDTSDWVDPVESGENISLTSVWNINEEETNITLG